MDSHYNDDSISQRLSPEAYEKRISEWFETIDSFLYLLKDMECWYHFCLVGFFYVPSTGKYAEVLIYQNDNPEFSYRCLSFSRQEIDDPQIHEAELNLSDLVEQLLWFHDPDDFYPAYIPVRWDMVEKSESSDSHPDMRQIDKLYKASGGE